MRRIRERLRIELRSLRGTNAQAVLIRLNPIIRGWSAYYRGVVSSETFSALDDYVWKLTYKWATYGHPNKSKRWVVRRYFGRFNRSRRDRWVFGDRASGVYLLKFAWTRIIRHQLVTGASSLDDPALAEYWAERRAKRHPRRSARPGGASTRPSTVAVRSAGTGSCPPMTRRRPHASGSSGWPPPARRSRSPCTRTARRRRRNLVSCTLTATAGRPPGMAMDQRFCAPASPRGLLEPDAVKVARPVLRGAGRSNASGLPGGKV